MRLFANKVKLPAWDNITKLTLVFFFTTLYFYLPIVALYYRERGLSYLQITSITGIIVGTMFFAEIPTGLIADRFGRKVSVILAMAFQLVGEVGYIFARDYLSFAVIAVVAGIGFTFSSGCVEALVYDTLKAQGREKDMQRAMGRVDSAGRLGAMLGAATSALVVSTLTLDKFVLAIILTAVAVGIGFVLSFTLEEPRDGEVDEGENSWLLLKDGVQLLAGNRNLQRIALLSLLTLPFEGYMSSLFQPYYVNAGVATPWFGLSAALGAFLAFLGSRYAYLLEKRFGVRLGTLLATISPGLLYLAMAVLVHPLFSVVLYCTFQGATGLRKPIFADYLNRHIESKNRATMLSFINMFSSIYVALIGLLIGWISDRSLMGAFIFMGVILLVSAFGLQIDERNLSGTAIEKA